jgi:hypothetical protein
VDDDKTFTIHHAKRNLPYLTIVFSIIHTSEDLILKNQGGVQHINAALSYDLLPLLLVPFEFQTRIPSPLKVLMPTTVNS